MVKKVDKEEKKKSPRKLEEKIKAQEEQINDLDNKWKRALADYQNQAKRFEKEKENLQERAAEDLVLKLLPIFNSLNRAASSIQNEGLDLVVRDFGGFLEELGIQEIRAEGEEFNPELHECIEIGEGEENKIIEVLEKGYLYQEKPILPAKVKVGKQTN